MNLNDILELSNNKSPKQSHSSRREGTDRRRPDFIQRWSQDRKDMQRDEDTPEIAKYTPTRSKSPKIQKFLGEISAFKKSNSNSKELEIQFNKEKGIEVSEHQKKLVLSESNVKRLTLENSNLKDMLHLKEQEIQDKIGKIKQLAEHHKRLEQLAQKMQAIAIQEKKRAAKYEQELVNQSSNKKRNLNFSSDQDFPNSFSQLQQKVQEYEKIIENQLYQIHRMKEQQQKMQKIEKENKNFKKCLK